MHQGFDPGRKHIKQARQENVDALFMAEQEYNKFLATYVLMLPF